MKIRKLLVPFAAGLLALSMASCDKTAKKNANYDVPAEFDTTKQINIVFYHTMSKELQAVLNTAIADFEKDYPNCKVDSQAIGGYNDVYNNIQTQIANDEQPNLAYCYSDHVASYNRAKAVVQLDNLINDSKFGFFVELSSGAAKSVFEKNKEYVNAREFAQDDNFEIKISDDDTESNINVIAKTLIFILLSGVFCSVWN